jgi:hypothetical protein
VGQAAPDKKPPKHDRELYAKYLVQLAEGKRLRVSGDSYVMREKGRTPASGPRSSLPRE